MFCFSFPLLPFSIIASYARAIVEKGATALRAKHWQFPWRQLNENEHRLHHKNGSIKCREGKKAKLHFTRAREPFFIIFQ